MQITRLGPVFGAEISGVDLGRLDDGTFAAIRQALVDHEVLVFKNQTLDTDIQSAFGRRFGELIVHHFSRAVVEARPELMVLDTNRDRPDPLTDIWHADETYRAAPPMATVLRSIIVPELGGNTMFASMRAAYEGLSSRMKDYVTGLTAVHGFGRFRHRFEDDPSLLPILHEIELANPVSSHPVVTVHPESGRRVLYVNWHFTTRINGLPEVESRVILDYLRNRVLQPEYQLRVAWEPGMLVVWDNRSVQHYAPKDYYPQHRQMERVTIAGAVPIGAPSTGPLEIPRVVVQGVAEERRSAAPTTPAVAVG
ncbi:MAG: TauD/TfdA family dioxygenase [Acidimicrobiia bacterium]|nr:TauD/TfdA family dioxygenase [Acidimicrobiia bacterium]